MISPPEYGRRLLPSLIDEIASTDPDRAFASITQTAKAENGFRDFSFKVFARAINHCAWLLEEQLGKGSDYPTIAYIGPQDLTYPILTLAAIKTGYKLFLPSPRNSMEAHISLLKAYNCSVFLVPAGPPPIVGLINTICSNRPMRQLPVPSLSELLRIATEDVKPYPFTKSYDEAKDTPFVALHTSGSTGLPTPVVMNHRVTTALDAMNNIPLLGGNPCQSHYWEGLRAFLPFPMFHAAGLLVLYICVYNRIAAVFGPPGLPTAEVIDSVNVHGNIDLAIIPPSLLVEIIANPEYAANLSKIRYVASGGGPVPEEAGNAISKMTHLHMCFGSTEGGCIPLELTPPEDWQYYKFSPFFGYEMRHYAEDLYELVIVRDEKLSLYQGIFSTFPNLTEYSTKDLFSKHPTKEDFWRSRGRSDDIIVYTTGEKFNPMSMEGTISSHSEVSSALVCGEGRFQSALLVEPRLPLSNPEDSTLFLERIWSTIEQANTQAPAHAKVLKDFVIFTSADKPMLRAGKGTVQRKMTVALYEAEIDRLFEDDRPLPNIDQRNGMTNETTNGVTNGVTNGDISLALEILHIVRQIPGFHQINLSDDLFEQGIDSLQILTLIRQIKNILPRHGLDQNLVSNNKPGKDEFIPFMMWCVLGVLLSILVTFRGMTEEAFEPMFGPALTWPAALLPIFPGMFLRSMNERPDSINGFTPENERGFLMAVFFRACTATLPHIIQWGLWAAYTNPGIEYPTMFLDWLLCTYAWIYLEVSPMGSYAIWLLVNQYRHPKSWFRHFGGGPSVILQRQRRGTIWYITTVVFLLLIEMEIAPAMDESSALTLRPQTWILMAVVIGIGLYLMEYGLGLRIYKYEYKPLQRGKSIRLLRLRAQPCLPNSPVQCNMIYTTLRDPPLYTAISHCCSAIGAPQEMILIDGGLFPVSRDIYSLLRAKRSNLQPRYYWIDSICINQEDKIEKSKQVGMMRNIFEEAERTLGCLGDRLSAQKAMDLTRRINEITSVDDIPSLCAAADSGWIEFVELMSNEWFERAWIIQEVAVAKARVLRYGDQEIDWHEFIHALGQVVLCALEPKSRLNTLLDRRALLSALVMDEIKSNVAENDLIKLVDLLKLALRFKATLSVDKVYALSNIIGG